MYHDNTHDTKPHKIIECLLRNQRNHGKNDLNLEIKMYILEDLMQKSYYELINICENLRKTSKS